MVFTKKDITKPIIIKILLCIELIIYSSFIYLDFITKYTSVYSTILKYIGILICTALSLLIGDCGNDKEDTRLLQIAFCFTATADLCLVILNYNTLGIFLFCFVQTTYIIRHSRGIDKKGKPYKILVFVILAVFTSRLVVSNLNTAGLDTGGLNEKLIMIGSVYLVLLTSSLCTAWKTNEGKFYTKCGRFCISIGMTLFFLCDINVGISGILNNMVAFQTEIGTVSRFLVWIFYLPSQVLLALSGYRR